MASWHFVHHNGYDDISTSTSADNFIDRSIRNLATALVREGVQNAMDARRASLASTEPVGVRMTLATVPVSRAEEINANWFGALFPHLNRKGSGAPEPPRRDEACRVLVFEDFGTTGLTGDYLQPYQPDTKNNFVNFLYHEGVTGKGNSERGSRGVGKIVFTMASRARTFFAYTIREGEARPVLAGKNLLKFRKADGVLLQGPAYYLDGWTPGCPRQPVTIPARLAEFHADFPVTRRDESGLSIVVPFLDKSVTAAELRTAIVTEFHFALLSGKLEITLADADGTEVFNASNVPPLGDEAIDRQVDLARWALTQPADNRLSTTPPKPGALQRLEAGHLDSGLIEKVRQAITLHQRVAVRIPLFVHPKNSGPEATSFDLFLEHSDRFSTKPVFVRELLPISEVRDAKPAPHVRALVVIDGGPLANLLRAAEGANHTDWSSRTDQFRENYRGRLGEIRFVAESVWRLMALVRGDNEKPVGGIATRYFSAQLPAPPEGIADKDASKGKKPTAPPGPIPPPQPKRYRIVQTAGGFVVRRGEPGTLPPARIHIRVAYDVLRGSAWSQYDPADFDLANAAMIAIEEDNAVVDLGSGKGNEIIIAPTADDFEVRITGFDTNRDLIVDARGVTEKQHADQIELHETQEAVA